MSVTWGGFRTVRPDVATKGRALLYQDGPGIGFLATVRPDGGPRVHPICPIVTNESLFAFIVPGPKLNDLRRNPRYALHSETSPPPHQDDAFYVTGTVREVADRVTWDRVAEQYLAALGRVPWPGFDTQALLEFMVDRCLLTLTVPEGNLPSGHTIWRMAGRR